MFLHFFAGSTAALLEALGSPDLKLVAKADKSDFGLNAGVGAKRLRKNDAPITINREDLDIAVQRDREFIALVRIVRQACEKPVDLLRKSLAACIEGRSIKRGVAIDATGISVTLENGAERCWDRDTPFGVDLVCECRDKTVHPPVSNLVFDAN